MAAEPGRFDEDTEHESGADLATSRLLPRWLLAFALGLPTLITWLYFVLLAKDPAIVQQGAYLLGKSLQLVLPIACVAAWRGRFSLPRPQNRDLYIGLLSGLLIGGAAWAGYRYVLLPSGQIGSMIQPLKAKLAGMQLNSRLAFILLGCFYALAHSLFEEYYWRWFVFQSLHARLRFVPAALISSLGFAAHHVLVLAAYFGGLSGMTIFLSLSVAVGGLLWAWMYQRSGVLYGAWLSHLLVDASLFWIGFDLLRVSGGF